MIIERHLLRDDMESMASPDDRYAFDAARNPNRVFGEFFRRISKHGVAQDARSSTGLMAVIRFSVCFCSSMPITLSACRTQIRLSKRVATVALAARPRSEACCRP